MTERNAKQLDPTELAPQRAVVEVVFQGPHAPLTVSKKRDGSLDKRGFELFAAIAEVSVLAGTDEELAKRRFGNDFTSFRRLPIEEKRARYAELREDLETNTTHSAFLSVLDAYADIAKDSSNGPMDDLVELEVKTRQREFDQSPLPQRLLHIARLRTETRDMLVDKFPIYLSFWEGVSQRNGETPENIRTEIAAMQERFDNASERGKAGISRSLREKVETADLTRFQTYLRMYEKLFSESDVPSGGTEDLPSPESFDIMFKSVDLKRKTQVLHELESKTHVLLSH